MKLYKHQEALINRNPRYLGMFHEMGLGKSLTAIRLAEKNASSVLVVCPKSLVENWRRELLKWKSKILTTKWLVVTKEEFRRDWENLNFTNQGLILDEAHHFSGYKSMMHKNALKWVHKNRPSCVYLLTGSPFLSSPFNIMCYEKLLGRKVSWMEYRNKYFKQVQMGSRSIPVMRKDAGEKLSKVISQFASVARKDTCLDLPEQIFLREDFELTKEQKDGLKDLDNDPMTVNHITYWTRRHQICGGTLKGDEKLKLFKSEKVERIKQYAKEYDKLIIVARYNAELEMLKSLLPDAVVVNGKTPAIKRQYYFDQVNSPKQGKKILLVNAAISEGYNLNRVGLMIFYSNGFSFKDRIQMLSRIHRIGQEGKCVYVDLVVKGDIDEAVLKSLNSKEDFSLELYGEEKRHNK